MNYFKRYHLKGSSLPEVLIALAITSFCATLAVIIFLSLQKSSLPFFKLKAMELAELRMKETLEKRDFSEETYRAEAFTVKRTLTLAGTFPDCSLVRITVFDGSKKKLYELETLVRREY